MSNISVRDFQWAVGRLEGKREMFSNDICEALKVMRYLVDTSITRSEIDLNESANSLVTFVDKVLYEAVQKKTGS